MSENVKQILLTRQNPYLFINPYAREFQGKTVRILVDPKNPPVNPRVTLTMSSIFNTATNTLPDVWDVLSTKPIGLVEKYHHAGSKVDDENDDVDVHVLAGIDVNFGYQISLSDLSQKIDPKNPRHAGLQFRVLKKLVEENREEGLSLGDLVEFPREWQQDKTWVEDKNIQAWRHPGQNGKFAWEGETPEEKAENGKDDVVLIYAPDIPEKPQPREVQNKKA